jgi:uncharacterized membrane protein
MNDFNRQNDEFWRWGIFYRNPDDSAIWVDKRTGIGWTLNFAHLESWIIIFMILAVPAVFLTLTILG